MTTDIPNIPTALPRIPSQTKDAIVDPIYRALLSIDTANPALFASAIHEAARFSLNGRLLEGADAIKTHVYDTVSRIDTTHHLSNLRITEFDEVTGTASLVATVLAQHYRQGEGLDASSKGLLAGGFYFVDVVREEGDAEVWRVKEWTLRVLWREGDEGVMASVNENGEKKEE
ncbi:hypothetical protein ASPACDRAFT_1889109 [Aspergillus aculeatus ATCC 16872]|uniref:SnoaL-like domain-containing protein n=1 Tax=Aspergillus aculeatus (strain ATCC 16872 / CBS 172.66 / WB 5094) TaxID=690307 RepID=A0A1L9WQY1_ASPA1|nr:uncharacterized protein ASPACDRAFT_1889109 [Aspergillus aculeatus ATCC 16872]OJJ98584.1 hypothetical protein ASPACDRAFT_1889109 [Aspergillus aculeatus ATCC 16872]